MTTVSAGNEVPEEGDGAPDQGSYGQIVKSTVLIGGASVVNIGVSVFRAKAMALLIGPAGVGLVGLYASALELTQSVAGMGLNSSGVRQIAEASGSGDASRLGLLSAVLRRTALALGILGAVFLIVFSREVSLRTFGSESYAVSISFLSLAVLFRLLSDAEGALLQGTRRIADLARVSALSALVSTVSTLALIFFLREHGIVPSLVATAGITLVLSWLYRRKLQLANAAPSLTQVRSEIWPLLTLGCAFTASVVLTSGSAYAVRTAVREYVGLESAGLYQSAWNLGGLYVGVILQAMGSDFYPRLTALANRHVECNRLVNQQTRIGLLLAGPGVIATLTFAPFVIALFYASSFTGAVEPLRWICLGMLLRVIAWPMGYIILAKNARTIFFLTEVAASVVHVGLAVVLVKYFGLRGATMAFFALYAWHMTIIYVIVRRLSEFRWSRENWTLGVAVLSAIALVFLSFLFLSNAVATTIGVLTLACISIYSVRELCRLLPLGRLPVSLVRLLQSSRLAPRPEGVVG